MNKKCIYKILLILLIIGISTLIINVNKSLAVKLNEYDRTLFCCQPDQHLTEKDLTEGEWEVAGTGTFNTSDPTYGDLVKKLRFFSRESANRFN